MVDLPLTGGCHCGALRYRITDAPVMVYNCHCTNCQKIGGGAFGTAVTIRETGFAFERCEPRRIEWTAESGTVRFGWFCGDCGSRIAHGQLPTKGVLSLRGGSLDDTSWLEPVADIWTRSAQPWSSFGERLTFEKQPADYSEIMSRFQAQGHF